jgi:hypothetical protein
MLNSFLLQWNLTISLITLILLYVIKRQKDVLISCFIFCLFLFQVLWLWILSKVSQLAKISFHICILHELKKRRTVFSYQRRRKSKVTSRTRKCPFVISKSGSSTTLKPQCSSQKSNIPFSQGPFFQTVSIVPISNLHLIESVVKWG